MKTKLYSLLALPAVAMLAPATASAQDAFVDETITVTEYSCDNTDHYFSNWRNNWFIQLNAGVNQPFVERGINMTAPGHAVDRKKMTATYGIGFGHWFSPYLGMRITALGGALHWDNPTLADPQNGWSKAKHVNVNAELMWDMFNSIAGPKDRVFSIVPFVGIGGDYTWNIYSASRPVAAGTNIATNGGVNTKTNSWTLPVSAGLQFRFRLSQYVDFFAEARASFYGDNWNGCAYGDPVEANVAVLGGFNINIGGRKYDRVNQCEYVSQIAALNNQVNDLRAQLLESGQKVAALESQLPCPEVVVAEQITVTSPLLATVRFDLNSAEILPTEQVNIYNMAEWLKANPDQKVTVCGYADKDTGSSSYNMELSKKRADAVVSELVKTYGISADRLNVKYDGSDVQPYSTNDWNRIVIFSQE